MRFLVGVLLGVTAVAVPAKIAIPIKQRADPTGDINVYGFLQGINYTLVQFGAVALPSYPELVAQADAIVTSGRTRKQRRATWHWGSNYLSPPPDAPNDPSRGLLTIGTQVPGRVEQDFEAIYDTSTADLYVPGPTCGIEQGCLGTVKYNNGGIFMGTGSAISYGSTHLAQGYDYKDNVTVGAMTAKFTGILSLTSAAGLPHSFGNTNARVGMAFSSMSQSRSATFFETLMFQDPEMVPEFSFFHGRPGTSTEWSGELTIGGHDANFINGPTTSLTLLSKYHWAVKLSGIFTLQPVSRAIDLAGRALVDTASSTISMPREAAATVFADVPHAFPILPAAGTGQQHASIGYVAPILWAFPCVNLYMLKMNLELDGTNFTVNAGDLNGGRLVPGMLALAPTNGPLADAIAGNVQYCIANIVGIDIRVSYSTDPLYLLGIPFLKNWYVTLSYAGDGSIRIAKAVDEA